MRWIFDEIISVWIGLEDGDCPVCRIQLEPNNPEEVWGTIDFIDEEENYCFATAESAKQYMEKKFEKREASRSNVAFQPEELTPIFACDCSYYGCPYAVQDCVSCAPIGYNEVVFDDWDDEE